MRRRYPVLSRLLALLLCALSGAPIAAESPSCARFDTLALEITAVRDSNPTEGVSRGEAALADAVALSPACPSGHAMLLGAIASNLSILGRNREAVTHFERALEVLGEAGTPSQIAFLNRGIGVALVTLESDQLALPHYFTALAASDAANDPIESAKTASNIGILYMNIGDLDQSRAYLTRSLSGFEQADFKPGIAGALINLGVVAGKFGDLAKEAGDEAHARQEYQLLGNLNERAHDLFVALGNQRGIAYAASNIGDAFEHLGQPQQALVHHQRSLDVRREIGDVFGTIDSLIKSAKAMIGMERYGAASTTLDEASALLPDEDVFQIRKNIAEQRVALAEHSGDFRVALAAQRDVTRYAALSADADQMARITALQDRFDADQAERQIELLRSDAHLAELQLQRQRQVSRLGMLASVLISVLLLVLYSRYRLGINAARTDDLTGLSNRRHQVQLMRNEVHRVERGSPPFCLLMADLDDFKLINDSHGHGVGDSV
ncbi:MAG: tetratricopeptide repeat protein, partial [Dokdonella sp.]